jgi:heme-degrading monooxygenase HmoA
MLDGMTGYHLAQVNVGRLVGPLESTELADFVAELPRINQLADRSPGFVWRMVEEGNEDATALRPDEDDDLLLINCSVWESVDALRNFTFHSDHLRVLSRRREWFHRIRETHQALWWIPSGHRPSVAEAMDRVARVREHGPGPLAFTFRAPFPAPDGAALQGHDGSAPSPA